MINKKVIQAAKKCYEQLYTDITQEEVNTVLSLFENRKEVSLAFDVHYLTVSRWKNGRSMPRGRNKLAFHFILNSM